MKNRITEAHNIAYDNFDRELKEHEKYLLQLLQDCQQKQSVNVLDLGCADGLFMEVISKKLKCKRIDGIDNDINLVSRALDRKYNSPLNDVFLWDVMDVGKHDSPLINRKYDYIIASGIFGFFDEFDSIVESLHSLLEDNGTLFIFNRCNSSGVDLKYAIKDTKNVAWDQNYHVFSVESFTKKFSKYFNKISSRKFELDMDISPRDDIYSSFTIKTEDNMRMVMTKYNLINEYYFFIASKT